MEHFSESQKAWQRFRRNRPAVAGLFFVAVATFVAVFGYCLVPDNSPDANFQLPDLALAPAGKTVFCLQIPLASAPETVGFWAKTWRGQPISHRLIPVEYRELQGDSVVFRRIGEKTTAPTSKIHLASLFFSTPDSLRRAGDFFIFKNPDGQIRQVRADSLQTAFWAGAAVVSRSFPLGTDKYGRCILSRLLLGFRVSLFVGLVAVLISLTLGISVGAIGGYFGGRTDDLVLLLINTVWSIPSLLLVFAIVLALGRGVGIIFLAVGLTMWVDVARVVRGQVLTLRNMPFVEAARSMGFGTWQILSRHVLPNLLGPVMVVAAGNFATAILVESGLSYLGFGVQAPAPSWGAMLNENYGYALSGRPLLALAPALVVMLTVLAFNLVGNGLRDALDVRG